jgi:hypothetical protein
MKSGKTNKQQSGQKQYGLTSNCSLGDGIGVVESAFSRGIGSAV